MVVRVAACENLAKNAPKSITAVDNAMTSV
jgi:hypothetical protein